MSAGATSCAWLWTPDEPAAGAVKRDPNSLAQPTAAVHRIPQLSDEEGLVVAWQAGLRQPVPVQPRHLMVVLSSGIRLEDLTDLERRVDGVRKGDSRDQSVSRPHGFNVG